MSSSTQKRGFRLPWAAERDAEDGVGAVSLEPGALAETPESVRADLGGGTPPNEEPETPPPSTDADPAASDVPHPTAEADMSETDTATAEPVEGSTAPAATPAAATAATAPSTWPTSDRAGSSEHAGDAAPANQRQADSRPRVPRRDNPLVAGLVKAMREAAIASREETAARLTSEAAARVEAIRTGSTDEAAALRKRADEDIAEIREWSKAEIARVRQETDERIEARKVELTAETERHAASVERQVEIVQSTVARFEADMERFFEKLLAETDPARLATLAEQAPEPPDLSSDARFDWVEPDDVTDGVSGDPAALEASAAAEAEAEATEGLDISAGTDWPASVMAAARRGETPAAEQASGAGVSRLLVTGLTSVAAISAFKGAVGSLAGVHSVSVSSGEPGVFVFSVNHHPGTDLGQVIDGLPGFSVRITEATGDGLHVTADEAAA